MTETRICRGKVTIRRDSNDEFDELLAIGHIHMEMMDDKTLWIGIEPTKNGKDLVHVVISSNGKLRITANEA